MPDAQRLPDDLQNLVEPLSIKVHDAWVAHRLAGGWRYGPERDDAQRTSPSIVPYDQLSQEERELDRVTVRRTLAALVEMGYGLVCESPTSPTASREQLLMQARDLIYSGQPLPAYDLTKRWLAHHADDQAFRFYNAMALRRCGALRRARVLLEEQAAAGGADDESRGLLAAVLKESFIRSPDKNGSKALDHLRRAQQLYQDVFAETGSSKYYHGINAATLAAILGQHEQAQDLARRVEVACQRAATAAGGETDYWLEATRGEAALVARRYADAARHYKTFLQAVGTHSGNISSTRQNARLLMAAYQPAETDRQLIEDALRPAAVVLFAGLPLDPAGALTPRLPEAIVPALETALDERLAAFDAGFGFSGAAAGSEILFLEAMLRRAGGTTSVVLPWPRAPFVATHVQAAGEAWIERFIRLLGDDENTPRVQHLVNASLGLGLETPVYEQFADQLRFGLARLKAQELGTRIEPLVVGDARRAVGSRPLAQLVDHWQSQGIEFDPQRHLIDVGPLVRRSVPGANLIDAADPPAPAARQAMYRVKSILFADVKDFSKMDESQLPAFVEYFVGGASSRLHLRPYRAEYVRRVGDGLLMVFENARDAGLCALELVDWVSSHSRPGDDGLTFWQRVGLPAELRMRVALHAGPMFACVDPLTGESTFEGTHINYAARIEPITPGNQVYASEAFAALAQSWPAPCTDFVCEYVGQTTLAKKFGEFPLYHVRRA